MATAKLPAMASLAGKVQLAHDIRPQEKGFPPNGR
jgi:hypothetical protein